MRLDTTTVRLVVAIVVQGLESIAGIQRQYPGISLKVVEENSKIIQQMLGDKVIGIGIYEKKSGFLDLPQLPYRSRHARCVAAARRQALVVAPSRGSRGRATQNPRHARDPADSRRQSPCCAE